MGPRITLQTQRILAAFLAEPRTSLYGLEIANAAGLPSGTIYPTLARLEGAGWVESDWEAADASTMGRPRRRYYRLTGEGERLARLELGATVHELEKGLIRGGAGRRVQP